METVRTTCPRDCYDACGVLVAVEDGRIKHVRGDPEHHVARGKLCRKCSIGYNGAFLDPELRLTTPLRRVGPKGTRQLRADRLGRGDRRRSPARLGGDHRPARRGEHPQRALHRHLRAHRHRLPAALLQPPRRDRGRARHRLQQRRPRRADLRLRLERGGLRPRGGGRGRVHRRVGREPLGERAASARPLAARGAAGRSS